MTQASDIVKAVLENLQGRGGFDGWWDEIDEDIQSDIFLDLIETVKENLNEPQTFSCVICMYSGISHEINRDDVLMVIGGMLVCMDHAPYAPGRTELAQAITAANREDEKLTKLAEQALREMK